jgi:hypothetical protein
MMNVNCILFVDCHRLRYSSWRKNEVSVIHAWLGCFLLNLSLRKIAFRCDTLLKLLKSKFRISIKVKSPYDGNKSSFCCRNTHFRKESLQVFVVDILVIPVIDLSE